jgi:hypothetical protein
MLLKTKSLMIKIKTLGRDPNTQLNKRKKVTKTMDQKTTMMINGLVIPLIQKMKKTPMKKESQD